MFLTKNSTIFRKFFQKKIFFLNRKKVKSYNDFIYYIDKHDIIVTIYTKQAEKITLKIIKYDLYHFSVLK